jgi:hypothetical protein
MTILDPLFQQSFGQFFEQSLERHISVTTMSVSICVCDFEGSDSVGRDFIPSERSTKERLRRSSVVGRTSSSYEGYKMGYDVSDKRR